MKDLERKFISWKDTDSDSVFKKKIEKKFENKLYFGSNNEFNTGFSTTKNTGIGLSEDHYTIFKSRSKKYLYNMSEIISNQQLIIDQLKGVSEDIKEHDTKAATVDHIAELSDDIGKVHKEVLSSKIIIKQIARQYPHQLIKLTSFTVFIFSVITLLLSKLLNKAMIAPDIGLLLVIFSFLIFGTTSLSLMDKRKRLK